MADQSISLKSIWISSACVHTEGATLSQINHSENISQRGQFLLTSHQFKPVGCHLYQATNQQRNQHLLYFHLSLLQPASRVKLIFIARGNMAPYLHIWAHLWLWPECPILHSLPELLTPWSNMNINYKLPQLSRYVLKTEELKLFILINWSMKRITQINTLPA